MTGFAERVEINNRGGRERARVSEWAPYRAVAQEDERRNGGRLGGFWVLSAFFLFSGITVAVARGHAVLAESYGISPESLLVGAWLIQGATALFGFVLALRWLRSYSH